MMTLSLCMIVHNEQEELASCLAPLLPLLDEIVIVDIGSTDGTKQMAKALGARVVDYAWNDNVAAARQFAFEQARSDYMMWLDAHESVETADCEKLRQFKARSDEAIDGVTMRCQSTFDADGRPLQTIRQHRIVRRAAAYRWSGAAFESLEVFGHTLHSDMSIRSGSTEALTQRKLNLCDRIRQQGIALEPRDHYYWASGLLHCGRYAEAAEQLNAFIGSGLGDAEYQIAACHKLSECYKKLHSTESPLRPQLDTLLLDAPRAELCCELGNYFIEKERFEPAIFWFRLATLLESPTNPMAETNPAAWTYLPHIRLSYCYCRTGEFNKAQIHHELSKWLVPDHPDVALNENRLKQQTV